MKTRATFPALLLLPALTIGCAFYADDELTAERASARDFGDDVATPPQDLDLPLPEMDSDDAPERAAPPKDGPAPVACGSITFDGTCSSHTLYYCNGETVETIVCSDFGGTCEPSEDGGFDCRYPNEKTMP
jgi:hypothetical protein